MSATHARPTGLFLTNVTSSAGMKINKTHINSDCWQDTVLKPKPQTPRWPPIHLNKIANPAQKQKGAHRACAVASYPTVLM